jgi:murein DD-endopeptidase MepM/ murein hydrolase activator NlpD
MRKWIYLATLVMPMAANAFSLSWPVECTLGQNCFLQNFVDHDTSPAARDFTCGPASYDGHDGTDIRLANLAAMRSGVNVKAVADGVVAGTRSNVDDASIRDANAPDVAGRECGNGVRITHADGYVTQSCHLMKNSIRVRTGQQVKAGDVIGQIGLSGQTEFPHLHLGVWKDNMKIDPFTGRAMNSSCNPSVTTTSLWAKPVAYQPTALLNDGFATSAPHATTMRDTPTTLATITADAPALLYWVDVMNMREGDVLTLTLTAPDGSMFAQQRIPFAKTKAIYFGYIGKKNSSGAFAVGNYTANVVVIRGGEKPVAIMRAIEVN